jgi:NADH-quinone oxidoreductase subunit F
MSLDDYRAHGGYAALPCALEIGPQGVIQEVTDAKLTGQGGAAFPTGVKWKAVADQTVHPHYVVCNADESEPGTFKDRVLMEEDPFAVIEALTIAGLACGAEKGYIYIRGEYPEATAKLQNAIDRAGEGGYLGDDILGKGVNFDIEIRRGAGAYVCGEETALLESIEGQRAMPRTRPPFPVESGLFGRPTVINNVETLFAVPAIVERGGSWFAGLGGGRGTKLFGLSGHLRRPGVVELESGCTLRTLIEEVGGGSSTGRPIRAAVVGGPSGRVVHARQFDEPLVPRGAVNPGTGGVVALDDTFPVREAVRTLLAFNMRESCGKCTPCREGTVRLLAMLDGPLDAARVSPLAEAIQLASLCGLGQAAALSVVSGLAEFPAEFGVS